MFKVYVSITDIASHNLSINNLFTNCLTIFGNKKARQLGSVALKESHGGSFWCGEKTLSKTKRPRHRLHSTLNGGENQWV
jgi:hypothetical protein